MASTLTLRGFVNAMRGEGREDLEGALVTGCSGDVVV